MLNPLRRPELLVCSLRGHFTPGADLEVVEEHHLVIARVTADGRRFVQCLRCSAWIVAEVPPSGHGTQIDDIDKIERPRRGRALRDAIVLRIIAVDRAIHTVAFGAVAIAAIVADRRIDALHSWAMSTLNALHSSQHGSGGASSHGILSALLTRLANVRPHSLALLAVFATIYATVSALEAVGLWRERRWAEYLTALATAGFLPLEVHELIKRVTFVRAGALVLNLAILVYLVWAKHLFGVGASSVTHEEIYALEGLPELGPPMVVAGIQTAARRETLDPRAPDPK